VSTLVAAHATGHPLQSTVLTISCHACTQRPNTAVVERVSLPGKGRK